MKLIKETREAVSQQLSHWVRTAVVDKYTKGDKEVYVATKGNEQLILTCERVDYPHGKHPHTNIVWISEGKSEVVHQDILSEKYNQIKHSTGLVWGEALEEIWYALYLATKEKE